MFFHSPLNEEILNTGLGMYISISNTWHNVSTSYNNKFAHNVNKLLLLNLSIIYVH